MKLELDQIIIKRLIDQSYKILDRDRLHLENVLSPDKFSFSFFNDNEGNTEKNLYEDLPFINTQETLFTKSQVSSNNPKSEMPLILNNQKELDNVRAKVLTLKYFFLNEIYNLRKEISSVRLQLKQGRLCNSRNNDSFGEEKNINQALKDKLH